jgi:putative hydrolase of HD superfamily
LLPKLSIAATIGFSGGREMSVVVAFSLYNARMESTRLEQQIRFIVEIDKLKSIIRRTYLIDGSRNENTAEHSWHISVMAMLLAEYANEPVDVLKVLKMTLIHDIVEIDAGDTFVYDAEAGLDKAERERVAADRLFSLLPPDQASEFRALWDEFEERRSAEARFAAALDRFVPQLCNFYGNTGGSWKEHAITHSQVIAKNQSMGDGAATLWEWTQELLKDAVAKGFLTKSP